MKKSIVLSLSLCAYSCMLNAQVADAGADIEICLGMSPVILNAQAIEQPCTGFWSQQSGPTELSFSDVNDPNCAITGMDMGVYVLQWSVQETQECLTSSDDLTLQVFVPSCEVANAGPGPTEEELCNATSAQLQANEVELPAIGEWSQISGPSMVFFSDVNDPNAIVGNLEPGTYLFFWTIPASDCCPETFDGVSFFVYDAPVPASYSAGDDIELCSPESSTQLSADIPEFPFSGVWSIVSGGGTFTNFTSPNSEVINIPLGENVYSWTLYDQVCENSTYSYLDTITVTVLEFCPPLSGDLDGDGEISMEEFNEIIGAFGCISDECAQYDLDGDGIVGMSDLLILIANMGD